MEKAKQAVSDFVSNSGKHKTTVDESVAPGVTNEHIKPHRHENVTTAVDREVHQDHHHTTVQPITHKETLPEEHHHNIIPVEHKSFEHGNERDVKTKLEQEAARFKNTTTKHDHTHSSTVAPTVEGERVHHHVHEHVQPVIEKEVVQPKVVHTTIPVHETHHAAAQHHGISTLPTKTLDEFKTAGGLIDGKGSTHHGEYDGCPRPYNKSLQHEQTEADRNVHHHTGIGHHDHDHHNSGLNGATGTTGTTGVGNEFERNRGTTGNNKLGNEFDQSRGTTGHKGVGNDFDRTRDTTGTGAGLGHNNHTSSTATGTGTTGTSKPSLLNRINPLKDTDGDGKKGIMD